jgi:hypothetical protein
LLVYELHSTFNPLEGVRFTSLNVALKEARKILKSLADSLVDDGWVQIKTVIVEYVDQDDLLA